MPLILPGVGVTAHRRAQDDVVEMEPRLDEILRAQRRRRRLRFLAGFALLLLVGALWAGLSTDPLPGGGFFGAAQPTTWIVGALP